MIGTSAMKELIFQMYIFDNSLHQYFYIITKDYFQQFSWPVFLLKIEFYFTWTVRVPLALRVLLGI